MRRAQRLAAACLCLVAGAAAYEVAVEGSSSTDDQKQVCSGMYGPGTGSRDPWIDVVFTPQSRGNLALVIYEWQDARYLGIEPDGSGAGSNDWADTSRVYICTLAAQRAKLCSEAELGQFIISSGNVSQSSIYTRAVSFASSSTLAPGATAGPFRYDVPRTGYYCVGTVPLQTDTLAGESAGTVTKPVDDGTVVYSGVVTFQNSFVGHLAAADYPKTWFYLALGCVYALFGAVWGFLCWRHRDEILPIQHYVSATLALLVLEMFAEHFYYRYINASATASYARILLIIVSIFNAARNSASFFLLCITCMGYGICRPSLGPVMVRVRILAAVHFVFGVIYSIGTVTIPLEEAGFFLLACVFPLSFSLTAFMMWTMWSLNATIADLAARKQTFKRTMFVRLHRILLVAVVIIGCFFVISSITFSNRLDDDFAPSTWSKRFFLLDGWLGLLYLAVFASIAYLWRPSGRNRMLSLSDELAQEEEYDLNTADPSRLRTGHDKDDSDDEGAGHVAEDAVVFDIGEDDADADDADGESRARAKAEQAAADRRREVSAGSSSYDAPPAYEPANRV